MSIPRVLWEPVLLLEGEQFGKCERHVVERLYVRRTYPSVFVSCIFVLFVMDADVMPRKCVPRLSARVRAALIVAHVRAFFPFRRLHQLPGFLFVGRLRLRRLRRRWSRLRHRWSRCRRRWSRQRRRWSRLRRRWSEWYGQGIRLGNSDDCVFFTPVTRVTRAFLVLAFNLQLMTWEVQFQGRGGCGRHAGV